MNKTDDLYLADMLQAIENIERFVDGFLLSQFEEDDMRYFAVIHMLEIIGEAANKISKDFLSSNPDFPARQVVEMRNMLIHGYDQVKISRVWDTIQDDLPKLKEKIISTLIVSS